MDKDLIAAINTIKKIASKEIQNLERGEVWCQLIVDYNQLQCSIDDDKEALVFSTLSNICKNIQYCKDAKDI